MREPGERRGGLIVLSCVFFLFLLLLHSTFFLVHFCIPRIALVISHGRSRSKVRENATYLSPLGSSMCSLRMCSLSRPSRLTRTKMRERLANEPQGEQWHTRGSPPSGKPFFSAVSAAWRIVLTSISTRTMHVCTQRQTTSTFSSERKTWDKRSPATCSRPPRGNDDRREAWTESGSRFARGAGNDCWTIAKTAERCRSFLFSPKLSNVHAWQLTFQLKEKGVTRCTDDVGFLFFPFFFFFF